MYRTLHMVMFFLLLVDEVTVAVVVLLLLLLFPCSRAAMFRAICKAIPERVEDPVFIILV